MKRLATVAVIAAVSLAGAVRAEEGKANPNGTWKYTIEGQNGQKMDRSITLKLDGDKLTGTTPGMDGKEIQIQDGKFDKKTGEVSFTVKREVNNMEITIKYSGKISGDTLKAKAEVEVNGQTRTREFEAKRDKAGK
jgi:hypothetical protein